ncbi:MAG: DNA translocase FtsK, partial [Firmicutes bacterium]|nr:DNA translocase FtsK [Bacillota bacterium]
AERSWLTARGVVGGEACGRLGRLPRLKFRWSLPRRRPVEPPPPPRDAEVIAPKGAEPRAVSPETANGVVRQVRERPARRQRAGDGDGESAFRMPQMSILARPKASRRSKPAPESDDRSQQLEETLASFGIQARVVSVSRGPVVTRYEVQPPPGVKVSRIVGLADDISLNLAAAGVRVEAPVPGKSVVGIEVPNRETTPVLLREILESEEFSGSGSPLTIAVGKDVAGNPIVADLSRVLHLLIAGATGSGKSVCLNSIIASLLFKATPDQVKMMMVDPKRVELSVYDGIPHLIAPVVTDPRQAAGALRWAVKEMERRYRLLSEAGVRNIDGYNRSARRPEGADPYLPYLVVIIDELADLMMVAAADVEDSICRLAQMARAAGIYLIIATQRPSVDVITGLIKANVPSRIAFAVSSQVDSRTILDMAGAERLLGKGDMLFYPVGAPKPIRAQGAWISDQEVEELADYWRGQGEPEYIEAVLAPPEEEPGTDADMDDELFDDAVRLVREVGQASVSLLQRRFRIGYSRAARLIDMMEMRGIVGPYQGSKPREVIGVDGGARQR